MPELAISYGHAVTVNLPYALAVEQTRAALAAEGFGVLCEADIEATFRQKLDVEFGPYVILGACNPPLAHRALGADRNIGLLLPCNVIVYAGDTEGTSVVAALDPERVLALAGSETLVPVAREVGARLRRALAAVAAASSPVDAAEEIC